MSAPTPTWECIAKEERLSRDRPIPKEWLLSHPPPSTQHHVMRVPYECGIMTARELVLTDKDATELLQLMATGQVTSYELTLAFCRRAAIAQQLVNCLTQIWFDEALQRARKLDEHYATHGTVVGPYHGLPISVKNQFSVKGKPVYTGFVAWVGNIADRDTPVVQFLRNAGAVFFCQTNSPQGLQSLETNNNITGRTLNPYNRDLSPGGSSGGEGALVGFHGSPFGLAADGGGSTRIPAACTGIVGMKCTSNRIPHTGSKAPLEGCDSTPYALGPVCRSVRDNVYFLKEILKTQPWLREPYLTPLPWRGVSMKRPITVGVFVDDGIVLPHPPVVHAVQTVAARLTASSDFRVVSWKPCNHVTGYEVYRKLLYLDGGAENYATMASSGEPCLELTQWIMKPEVARRRSIEEMWALNRAREEYRQQYLDHWRTHPESPDVLLCPVGPFAAPRHDTSKYWGYSAIYNLLDYPACAVPTGLFVDPTNPAHARNESYLPRENEFDRYIWELYNKHGPEGYAGAPIGVQIVGRKWECETVMEVAALVEAAMKAEVGK